ncbi:hypothetical protein AMTRI_Chr09g18850 [Amborella trichopoda]
MCIHCNPHHVIVHLCIIGIVFRSEDLELTIKTFGLSEHVCHSMVHSCLLPGATRPSW